ncbi:hypothetical protein BD410DRAFT_807774 [Rickenella mellea]|uniref:Uncharacterized protein n=1 Tax=Rickenella mellea TaxID=50990 RepID=A0A4Y7PNW4_9AGAM|nr:hypothetical protein BD410DRAFT_807774 [Rickenella mellea]
MDHSVCKLNVERWTIDENKLYNAEPEDHESGAFTKTGYPRTPRKLPEPYAEQVNPDGEATENEDGEEEEEDEGGTGEESRDRTRGEEEEGPREDKEETENTH